MEIKQESKSKRIEHLSKEALKTAVKRRTLLKGLGAAAAAIAAPIGVAKAVSKSEEGASDLWETFFQKHYQEMTPEYKEKVFSRLARETKQTTGVDVRIGDPQPIPESNLPMRSISRGVTDPVSV